MEHTRNGDLVLAQGTFAFIQDGSTGNVDTIVGPAKVSLAESDRPVEYNKQNRTFEKVSKDQAVKRWATANEGEYIVLYDPVESDPTLRPKKGKQAAEKLSIGNKIIIAGPESFPLWPGQAAEIIAGHQLKSNEYLLVRVYNEKSAIENINDLVVKSADAGTKKKSLISDKDLITGNLMVIKGTDVSFFIPPTGIEVVPDELGYTSRPAVTLERLEYCILLDQNGDKRYTQGPAVVFPKPTEEFIDSKGNKTFTAIELNDIQGLYIKVIADYKEGNKSHKAGDELFITGKEQRIYFPRPEHAIIKYGAKTLHYATAIPEGEARYVLDKEKGNVSLVHGPKMYLPDPITDVIVKRVLSDNEVELWFPGNREALQYNRDLMSLSDASENMVLDGIASMKSMASTKSRGAAAFTAGDNLHRSQNYTKPRTIQLDTKYDGAVSINVWPGSAVQVVSKTGHREVIVGPKTRLLEFNESLEPLSLSTGKPKRNEKTIRTVYLQVKNNVVSDIVHAETTDMVDVSIRVSYRVNFDENLKDKWFNVSDYVRLLSRHMRSKIRNAIKKINIQNFNDNSTDIIRDIVLGTSVKGKRALTTFDENGMVIYDVEVLDVEISDREISQLLQGSKSDHLKMELSLAKDKAEFEYLKETECITRNELVESAKTEAIRVKNVLADIDAKQQVTTKSHKLEVAKEATADMVAASELARKKAASDLRLSYDKESSAITTEAIKAKMATVTPQLAEALVSMGNGHTIEVLAKNLKAQGGGLDNLFQKGGISGLLEAVVGTPIESQIKELFNKVDKKSKAK